MSLRQVDHEALAAQDPAGRLYNDDLKPEKPDARKWNAYSLFAVWMNDAHNLGNYTFAAGLFLLGLSPLQVTLGILGGVLIIFAGCCMSGFMGHDTGTPFPVACRLSWGVWGANVPAVVRGIVAIAWYGIQTYLAALALKVLLLRFIPGLAPLEGTVFLGLDLVGWIAFLILWVVQLAIFSRGMETVRHFQGWAGPVLWLAMIVLAVWMLWQADWTIAWFEGGGDSDLSTAEQWYHTFAAAGLTVGVLATLMLNFSDFARYSPSRRSVITGNVWGLPFNWTAFALTSVIVSAAAVEVYGEVALDPALLLQRVDNDWLVLLGSLVFVVATIGVNIVANFVSPAFDISNINPRRISFKVGGVVTSVLALVSLPWNLYNSPEVIAYFLGGLGALLGPFFGVMTVDYFALRKGHFSIADMYEPSARSIYYYKRGLNPRALAAFAPAAVVSLVVALVPVFSLAAPFSWFIGAGLSAVFYYFLARGRLRIVPGDLIDRESGARDAGRPETSSETDDPGTSR